MVDAVHLKGGEELIRKLEKYLGDMDPDTELHVGFLSKAQYPDGTPVAQVAAWNEYGSTEGEKGAFRPPRPFFRIAISKHKEEWRDALLNALRYYQDAKKAFDGVGKLITEQVQASIRDLVAPPLSPVTIKAKGHSKPLIETSHMLNSVDYEIVKK